MRTLRPHHDPRHFAFDRNSRLRKWHFEPPHEPLAWLHILFGVCIGFGLMTLVFFAVQVWR